MKFVFSFL